MQTTKRPSPPSNKPSTFRTTFWDSASSYLSHVQMFSRNARLYLLGAFLLGINFEVFQLLLNLYLREQGYLASQIGLVNSARAVGMTIMAFPAAYIISRIRLKPILIVSATIFLALSFLVVTTPSYELILLATGLAGMSFTFSRVAAAPFYMRNSSEKERMHLFSFSFGVLLLAGMVGSFFAGRVVMIVNGLTGDTLLGYRYTMYGAMVVSLLALIPFSRITGDDEVSEQERKVSIDWAGLRSRGGFYTRLLFAHFLVGTGAGLIIPFLNLYFRDRFNLSPDKIGTYYFLVSCAMFVGTMLGPVLTRRFGLVRSIVMTQLLSIPFMLILAYTFYLPLAVLAFVVRGGLMNIGVPIGTNFGMEMCHPREQGFVNALLMIAWTGSWMFATAIGGSLIEDYGYTVVMHITAGLYVASSLCYYFFFRNTEQKKTDEAGWIMLKEEVA